MQEIGTLGNEVRKSCALEDFKPAFDRNNVAVITSSGEGFCPYVGVLIQSIAANASPDNNYDFILLHDGLTSETERNLLDIVKGISNFSVRFVDVSSMLENFDFKSVASYIKPLTCARLLIPEVFGNYEKAIWIDADTVVNRDIADLYHTDIRDYYIAAIPDNGSPHFFASKPGHFMIHIIEDLIGIPPGEYFNGGVQVLNCTALRQRYSANYCLMTAARSDFRFLDQDAMNFLCRHHSKLLDPRWNVRAQFDDLVLNGSEEVVSKYLKSQEDPYIIHYIGPDKPGTCRDIQMSEYFWKYANQTMYNKEYWDNVMIVPEKPAPPKKKENISKKLKMRLLPPSSRSFWSATADFGRKLDRIESKAGKTSQVNVHFPTARLESIEAKLDQQAVDLGFEKNKKEFTPEADKVRIVFLFQIASFWPNWESFYKACETDSRFEVKLLHLPDLLKETLQVASAADFLANSGLPHEEYSESILYEFNPHIVVLQSPYDPLHRYPEHQSAFFKEHGYRVIYIPYGIELADTDAAREDHFQNPVVNNAWKVYTFSERMKQDYVFRTNNGTSIQAFGHPKFDGIADKDSHRLSADIRRKIGNRKIVLWHLHFPKEIIFEKKKVMCTPMLYEYYEFLNYIEKNQDVFFLMLAHPKFVETSEGQDFIDSCDGIENLYLDWSDDYRPALYAADYMISDRSAMLIEAGPLEIPILYMHNPDFYEPLTEAVSPLVDTYYKGSSFLDMYQFVDQCLAGEDPGKKQRLEAVKLYLPQCDGEFGRRIRDDIYATMEKEAYDNMNVVTMLRMKEAVEQQAAVIKTCMKETLEQQAVMSETRIKEAVDQRMKETAEQSGVRNEKRMREIVDQRAIINEMRMRREVRGGFYNLNYELQKNKVLPQKNYAGISSYDGFFYEENRYNSVISAAKILKVIMPAINARTVVDFGCGSGTWLYVIKLFGAETILGVDGDYINRDTLMIDPECFMPMDLENPKPLGQRYDLAISVEVAEHLVEAAADGFVETICSASDVVLFSAAHPGQGGTDHYNEQPFEYWEEKFGQRGYRPIEIRQFFKDNLDIGYEYRTNITIYATDSYYDDIQAKISAIETI